MLIELSAMANSELWFLSIDALKRSLNSLLSRTHDFLNEVASPLVKTGKPEVSNDVEHYDIKDMLVGEQTIPSEMPDGNLSLAAVVSIEQFSRWSIFNFISLLNESNVLHFHFFMTKMRISW